MRWRPSRDHEHAGRARNREAASYLLVSVALYSTYPLVFVALSGAAEDPFLVNLALHAGAVIGSFMLLALLHRPILWNAMTWRAVGVNLVSAPVFMYVLANFDYLLFAWSSSLIDVSVATILFEFWPILHVVFMAWLFRREERYARVTVGVVLLLYLCFAGVALTILSQVESGRQPDVWAESLVEAANHVREWTVSSVLAHPAWILPAAVAVAISLVFISRRTADGRVEDRLSLRSFRRQYASRIRGVSHSTVSQFSRLPILYRVAGFCAGLSAVSTAGYIGLERLVAAAGGSNDAVTQALLGGAIAMGASILAAGGVLMNRWGSDVGSDYLAEGASEEQTRLVELAFAMLGVAIGRIPLLLFLYGVGVSRSGRLALWNDGSPGILSLWQVGLAALVMVPAGQYLWRKANITTHSLGVNSISFFTPVAALALLWLFGQVNVAHNDYLVIGAAAIFAGNLIVNFSMLRNSDGRASDP